MTIRYPTPEFKVGDKVAYSIQWLKSGGMSHSDIAHARGVVRALKPMGRGIVIVTVAWEVDRNYPRKILASNLALVGPNPRFANID